MLLHLYNKRTGKLSIAQQAVYYDADTVHFVDAIVTMHPDEELSRSPELSETLRADYRLMHPSDSGRIRELEMLLADLLFGGDPE